MTMFKSDPPAPALVRSVALPALKSVNLAPPARPVGSPPLTNFDELPDAVDPMALSLNENPFPPLPAVQSAIVKSIGAANRYPEFYPERLRSLVADHIGADKNQVVIGAGATGVILQVLQAMTSPGDRVVFASPTFDGYPILARMARLVPVAVPLTENGCHDLGQMADAAAAARVVAICRPHNPTGTVEPVLAIERFLTRILSDTVVLVDEAYAEFIAPRYRVDWIPLLRRFPNVVVTRTFSKAYGLAGMRIGYGFGSPEVVEKLWSMQLPFGVGLTSMVAVAASYRAEPQLRQRIRLITMERHTLRSRLRMMGISSHGSHANFVYLPPVDRPWRDVFGGDGLRLRHYPDGATRITIGERPSTRAVLRAVRNQPQGV